MSGHVEIPVEPGTVADAPARTYREGDDPIWEASVRGELDPPPEDYWEDG